MFADVYTPFTADSPPNQIELSKILHRYFSDIVHWVASLFGSIHANSDSLTDAIVKRLMDNAMELPDLLRSVFSDSMAQQFEMTVEDFYKNLRDIARALKSGDMEAAYKLNKALYADMDKIASLLGSVGSIDQTALQTALYEFVYLMLTEAMLIFAHNYDAAIEVYDREMELALRIADSLAYSILQRGQG